MKKILVVDDSKTIRTLCEWIYKGLDDCIFTADSAAAAREIIQREAPDVVIVDYTLPDADAYEFVASIQSQAHVVMMGGTYAPFDEEKARRSGAVAILMKPFKTAVYFETVEVAMNTPLPATHTPLPAAAAASSASHPAVNAAQISGVSPAVEPVSVPAFAPISSSHRISASGSNPVSGVTSIVGGNGQSGIYSVTGGQSGIHSAKRFNFPSANSGVSPLSPAATKDHATPKTPIPSLMPPVQPQNAPQPPLVDPALVRAEVIAAVKAMLPTIVNSYLKKLIQVEVKPQLQNWVDTRVENLIRKFLQQ